MAGVIMGHQPLIEIEHRPTMDNAPALTNGPIREHWNASNKSATTLQLIATPEKRETHLQVPWTCLPPTACRP